MPVAETRSSVAAATLCAVIIASCATSHDRLPEPDRVEAIASSTTSTCALSTQGRIHCWGFVLDRGVVSAPMELHGSYSSPAVAVAVGEAATCSTRADGTVLCATLGWPETPVGAALESVATWGQNVCGIASGSVVCTPIRGPLSHSSLADTTAIIGTEGAQVVGEMGLHWPAGCAYLSDGWLSCWGGTGNTAPDVESTDHLRAERITRLSARAIEVIGGSRLGCAVLESGVAECWGGAAGPHTVSVPGHTIVEATNGARYVRTADGSVFQRFLESGDAATRFSADSPFERVDLPGRAIDVSGVSSFACALITTGEVYCWGENDGGQLGDGTREPSTTPVPVTGLPGVGG